MDQTYHDLNVVDGAGPRDYPRNGLLSGMILPILTAGIALLIGFFVPDVAQIFSGAPSLFLLDAFLVSICLLGVHKLESYFTHEYDVCPVYLTSGRAPWSQNNRQAIFVVFVGITISMSFVVCLIMRGAPWPLLLLSIWMAQGMHELHHSAKSLAQRSYYSGTVSAIAFVAQVDLVFFPRWHAELGVQGDAGFYFYYLMQPIIFIAFYFEHRRWLASTAPG